VRYMMMVKAHSDYEAGKPPNPALMAEIGKLAEDATVAGKMISTGGLAPSSASTRITLRKGKRSVVDGPFGETKELIGGFAIFELASKQEAIEYANRFVDAHVRCGVTDFEMDIRPMFGPEVTGCPSVAAE
jgi:hypothetical protein